jgi:hypothetical protein
MPPDSFLHERSDFKALVETVTPSRLSASHSSVILLDVR